MLRIYNTLSKQIETFVSMHPPRVGMYSCGPTVYDYTHIGHIRRYVGDDILVRILSMNKYDVKHVMNITDVGHLTSDSDTGEDKMEKGARKFNMTVWDIAKRFEKQFFDSTKQLNVEEPSVILHATACIKEQIALISLLEKKEFVYKTEDGVYFDTGKLSGYGKLAGQSAIKEGARVEINPEKKSARDFALWKFTPSETRRQMEWDSPWGIGFPGWHIECSAMAMKEFGPTVDIHTGGIDHIPIHHTNEIAQSEAATGKPFVRYFVHHAFLLVEGQKMSKSLGNVYTVQDLAAKGYDLMALRYLYLQTHYRQEMNFTFDALEASYSALKRLRNEVSMWDKPQDHILEFENRFKEAVNDDMNMSQALAVMWDMVRSDNPSGNKARTLFFMDTVLGLDIVNYLVKTKKTTASVPEEVKRLVKERDALRLQKSYHLADEIRKRIEELGYVIVDDGDKTKVEKE